MEDDVKSGLMVIFAIVVIVLIGYNIYTGATIQEIGIPGIFTVKFNQPGGGQVGDPPAPASQTGSNDNSSVQTASDNNSSSQRSITGNWTGVVGDLTVAVTKVELLGLIGDKKRLRFYISVNNQTSDSISLPLFKSFTAVGNDGSSYESDSFISKWPNNFPPGSNISGSVDLKDPVNANTSTMSINFSAIYGSVQMVGNSISVSDISIP